VLSLGAVFAIFAGWYYWFPKMSGYIKYNGFIGGLHFWLMFIGVNLIFFPQHFLGLPACRAATSTIRTRIAGWNYVSSVGSYITLAGVFIFLIMLAEMFLVRRKAGDNPWGEGATTLEWTLSSPPPFHQFKPDTYH
jgi:cytochrome c oxidase subunit 1